MQAQELVLRDVHVPAAPSWWPPAPGWWLLAGAVALVLAILWWVGRQRRRRKLAWQKLFDDACGDAAPAAQVAAISELLRRAVALIEERVYEIGAVLSLEVGKNRMEALGEAQETADLIAYY